MNDQQRMFEPEDSNYRFNFQLNHAAMQMALNVLEELGEVDSGSDIKDAITALRQALSQPQENTARCGGCDKTVEDGWALYCVECWEKAQPQDHSEQHLNMVQGEWVDLTDYEIGVAFTGSPCLIPHQNQINGLRAVIAKFKEKNTPPVVQQGEPVAWIEHEWSGTGSRELHFERRVPSLRDEVVRPVWTPLYTAPPSVEAATSDEEMTKFANGYLAGYEDAKEKAAKVSEELTPTDADGVCPVAAAIRSMK
jgi:hypothetical protein